MATTRPLTLDFRGRPGILWLVYAVQLIPIPLGTYILVLALRPADHYRAIGLGLAALLLTVGAICVVYVLRQLRPILLRRDQLRIVRGVRRTSVAVSAVSGVGLLFRALPAGGRGMLPGWYLTIWDGAGNPQQVRPCLVNAGNWTQDSGTAELPFENSAVLAETGPGRIAIELRSFVLRAQGSGGLLASREMQKHPAADDRWQTIRTYAFWSPDGEISRVR